MIATDLAVCVVSNCSLDDLAAMVGKYFADVPNRARAIQSWSKDIETSVMHDNVILCARCPLPR